MRRALPPVALASVAAALAWLIAHRLLGHAQPFFAPIAAAISLSTSRIQRSRRIAQMVIGVLLGIAIGEALAAALGTSTVALGVIVFVTLSSAVAAGAGLFGEGMMFANQAAASAILVVTLHRHGTGSERAVDAIVGGGVALVLGVGLFPAEPLSLLRGAEQAVLRTLVATLRRCALDGGDERVQEAYVIAAGHEIHEQLAALSRARSTAHANVRVAPRRWHLRSTVDAEAERTARLHLLGNGVLASIREVSLAAHPVSSAALAQINTLAEAIGLLADRAQPWSGEVRAEVLQRAESLRTDAESERTSTVAAILGATASDIERLVAAAPEARLTPPRPDHATVLHQ